jgi:O-6-methylguanine DNA methyltransferase
MMGICVGSIQAFSNRWIAMALERPGGTLVACTSSTQSPDDAERSLQDALLRLKRLDELDDTLQLPNTSHVSQQLVELMRGDGQSFSLDQISQTNWSSARRVISEQLLKVPRGMVISYGELAKRSNSSPRGVGSVMRSNPVPWAIPCHRVIHSDGRLGKLGGSTTGTAEKARILRAEGVLFNSDESVPHSSFVS